MINGVEPIRVRFRVRWPLSKLILKNSSFFVHSLCHFSLFQSVNGFMLMLLYRDQFFNISWTGAIRLWYDCNFFFLLQLCCVVVFVQNTLPNLASAMYSSLLPVEISTIHNGFFIHIFIFDWFRLILNREE